MTLNYLVKPAFHKPRGIWAAVQTLTAQTSPWKPLGAWLGDAVLALYVRERILREQGKLDGGLYTRMTSNHLFRPRAPAPFLTGTD